jgi:type III secretion protein J
MQTAVHSTSLRFLRLCSLAVFVLSLLLLTGCESKKTIVNGLDEKEANEIVVFLAGKGIDAQKVQAIAAAGGAAAKQIFFDISVTADQATEAMSLLNQAGLPRRRGQNLLGIFSNVGLVPSDIEQKIRYQQGLAEQIASTIRKIDGVLDAEVQISFPEEDPLNPGQMKGKITASVYVKHSGVLDDPNAHLTSKIKRLVAASVTGLDYDNVTVISDRARASELLQSGLAASSEEEKQYVTIWSMIIGKESVFRFRAIFFSFTLLILFLLICLAWVLWKVGPLLGMHGGVKELFHLRPIKSVAAKTSAPPAKSASTKAAKKSSKEADDDDELGMIDRDIDET